MRGLLILALVGLFPVALAQAPLALVTVDLAPFDAPVRPLQGAQTTEATVRVSCALAEAPGNLRVRHAIVDAPPWATVVVSPSEDVAGPERCQMGYATFVAVVAVNVSDQAPADVPRTLTLESRAGSGEGGGIARDSVDVTASWFSILDVQLPEAIAVVPPGGSHAFPVKLTNFGNGATDVTIRVGDVSEGISVRVPDPVRLGSKQQGVNDISQDVDLVVVADEASGFVNRVAVANLALTSTYASDGTQVGDESTVSLLVTVRTGAAERAAAIPAAPPLLALLFAAALPRAFRP